VSTARRHRTPAPPEATAATAPPQAAIPMVFTWVFPCTTQAAPIAGAVAASPAHAAPCSGLGVGRCQPQRERRVFQGSHVATCQGPTTLQREIVISKSDPIFRLLIK
jgi:hypothetical protein